MDAASSARPGEGARDRGEENVTVGRPVVRASVDHGSAETGPADERRLLRRFAQLRRWPIPGGRYDLTSGQPPCSSGRAACSAGVVTRSL